MNNVPPNPRPWVDVAVAVVYRDGRWLVSRRHAHVHLGGSWEFPGGKRERGEDAVAAALRELHEECHVEARPIRTLTPVTHAYPERTVRLYPVLCAWLSGEGATVGNDECRWVTMDELQRLALPDGNAPVLRELMELTPADMARLADNGPRNPG